MCIRDRGLAGRITCLPGEIMALVVDGEFKPQPRLHGCNAQSLPVAGGIGHWRGVRDVIGVRAEDHTGRGVECCRFCPILPAWRPQVQA